MDPNANFRRQVELVREIAELEKTNGNNKAIEECASELKELVLALASWLNRGGFVPTSIE